MVDQPSKEQVLEQLGRIVESDEFKTSPGIRKFLNYIVVKTLDGEQARLKGFAIGVDVFERGEQFDPQADTIVRVQARNLRRALRLYNLTSGTKDPVEIELIKGSYIPKFKLTGNLPSEPKTENVKETQTSINEPVEQLSKSNSFPDWIRLAVAAAILAILVLIAFF